MRRPLLHRPTRRPWRRPERRLSPGGGFVGSVTFPATPLRLRVYIALGADLTASWLTWSWVDITEFVRFTPGINTQTGRPDEKSVVTRGQTTLTVDNRDGRFTRRNPTGPYYGLLSKNTPLWIQVDAGSGFKTRVMHYVNEWPSRRDRTGNDSTVTITASGILRRLAQGTVQRSPLYWSLTAATPIAYWPLEDGAESISGASAIAGGTAMRAVGSVTWSGEVDLVGSQSAPTITSCRLDGKVSGGSASSWWVTFAVKAPFGSVEAVRVRNGTLGVFALFEFVYPAAAGNQLQCFILDSDASSSPGTLLGPVTTSAWANTWHHIGLAVSQDDAASQATATLWVDGVEVDSITDNNISMAALSSVEINPARGAITSVAHVACGDGAEPGFVSLASGALYGYAGELAKARISRMCTEGSIGFLAGGASQSQALGPQPIATRLGVMRDAEATDLGVLYEAEFGLAYQSKMDRYDAAVGMSLTYATHIADPLEPADDDQQTRNRFTATRSDGSEATIEDADSIAAEGLYDDSAAVNTYTDDQLVNIAGWLVHQGTVDEDRWPFVSLNFARNPALIDPWTALGFGARLDISSPPDGAAPDTIDVFIEGHEEQFTSLTWAARANTTPASTYEVYQVSGDNNRGRVDSGTAVLAADVDSGSATLSVASTGVLWVQGAVNFDIGVLGERMTVTNISGASSPQTFTVTRSVNGVVKALTAIAPDGSATKVRLWRPGVTAL